MTNDQQTSIAQLKELIADFVAERDWEQFHSPKNLSMSIAIESAELMEHFQWLTIDESRQLGADSAAINEVAEELADVLSYALAMANSLGIDISQTITDKMRKNRIKYPADQYQGRYGSKDTRNPPSTSGNESSGPPDNR